MASNKRMTVTLKSKGGLELPETVVDGEGASIGLAELLLENMFRTKLLEARERQVKEQGGRRSAGRLREEREQIEKLAEPVRMATEEISLQCEVSSIETAEKLEVRFDGFNALTVHFLAEPESMFLLEGEMKSGVFAVKVLTLLGVLFSDGLAEEAEEEEKEEPKEGNAAAGAQVEQEQADGASEECTS